MELDVDRLHIGDNLDILSRAVPDESIDLVYLDPPFKSNRAYHLIFRDESGRTSDAQQVAFDDSWHWGPTPEAHFRLLAVPSPDAGIPPQLSVLIPALIDALKRNELTAYLVEMAVRLVELHRVLRPTGSIYLHCDPTASHYLKLVMDAIFGATRFRSEIIWKRSSAHSDTKQGRRQHGRIHDVILYYTKGDQWTWNPVYTAYDEKYISQFYRYVEPETGRRYRLGDLTGPGGASKGNPHYEVLGVTRYWRHSRERMQALLSAGRIIQTRPGGVPQYKRYLDEMPGVALQDLWTDLDPVGARARERIGYPTQKPLSLLDRIIRSSTNPGDIVLDPFAGCGTAIEACIEADPPRHWIGIDISDQAHRVINQRFKKLYGVEVRTGIIAPKDTATARALAHSKPDGRRAFERWAINLIGGRPNPGRDRGVDGLIPFVGRRGRVLQALVSVKSGKIKPGDVRDLKGAVSRERAAVGVLITLEAPSEEMRLEATSAGFYEPGVPRLQIITIARALDGERPELPRYRQQELFAEVSDAVAYPMLADRVADLEEQIAEARRSRRRNEGQRLERLRESVRRVLEAEELTEQTPLREPKRRSAGRVRIAGEATNGRRR